MVENRPMQPDRAVVLVAGAESPTGLGVARALRDQGLTIIGLTSDTTASPCRSALWHEIVDEGDGSPEAWIAAVRGVAARHGRTVLIPVRDDVVELLAAHAEDVARHVEFVLPPADVVTTLLDKTAFHRWAVDRGFPVPHTEIVANQAELDAALARIPYPAVIKPFERTAEWQAVSPRHKAYRLGCAADITGIGFRLFDAAPRFVLQQWIPGTDADVWFCLVYRDRTGREIASQVGRKLVQWPVGTGCTALATTAADEELHALTRDLLDAAGHIGVGSLEVKRSTADGKLYITEPTVGRPNLQSNVATAAGVNLTLLQYRDALGLDLPAMPAPRPAVWVHETSLPRAMAVAAARRALDVKAVAAGLRAAKARMAAFGAPADRTPLTAELRRLGGKAVGAARGRVHRTRPAPAPAPAPVES
jgi:predicted ATP-grasp superfamily ATP-dependent carboligase